MKKKKKKKKKNNSWLVTHGFMFGCAHEKINVYLSDSRVSKNDTETGTVNVKTNFDRLVGRSIV